ncbi:hypothetical protein VPH49_22120 [Pseudomonas luteola]|uniref:hypothetical protein n=1 Tax=Pseudomonas luteola TaxID=47886 RepID=UPI003A899F4A
MSCTPPPGAKTCRHKHKFQGTGAVFYQSTGWIECAKCRGWQRIKKAVYPAPEAK